MFEKKGTLRSYLREVTIYRLLLFQSTWFKKYRGKLIFSLYFTHSICSFFDLVCIVLYMEFLGISGNRRDIGRTTYRVLICI